MKLLICILCGVILFLVICLIYLLNLLFKLIDTFNAMQKGTEK